MLMRLNFVIVYTSDMQRSVAFYRDTLGFPVKMESPDWTEFHTGATTLALHHAKPAERPRVAHGEPKAGEAHLGLEVLDIEKFYEEEKAKGVEFTMPPTLREFGCKLAIFVDPDGLPISVTEEVR
jgi:lactoylglutathione lyase